MEEQMKRFIKYISAVRKEGAKVVWPDKKKIKKDTITVLCVCAFFALLYWGVNSSVLALVKTVLGKAL